MTEATGSPLAAWQSFYVILEPVLEDWVWHAALPFIAYVALSTAALALGKHPRTSLFIVVGTVLLLMFIGIHNAWDTVTFIALDQSVSAEGKENA